MQVKEVPDHSDCPSAMFRVTDPSQAPQAEVQADSLSNVSTAGCAEDLSKNITPEEEAFQEHLSMIVRRNLAEKLQEWLNPKDQSGEDFLQLVVSNYKSKLKGNLESRRIRVWRCTPH